MSLYRKLLLFLFAATFVPMVLVGFALIHQAESALRDRIEAAQLDSARAAAQEVGSSVEGRISDLEKTAHAFDLQDASDEELEAAVRLLYRVGPEVAITLMLDTEGSEIAPPAFLEDPAAVPELAEHPARGGAAVSRLTTFLPLEKVRQEGAGAVILSRPYRVPEEGECAVAVALPVTGRDGKLLVFAVELSLAGLQRRARSMASLGELTVIDAQGLLVAHPDSARLREQSALQLEAGAFPIRSAQARRLWRGDEVVLAGLAPVPVEGLGWSVALSLPEGEAFASIARLRWVVGGASLLTFLLLMLLGWRFTSGVGKALGQVRAGAEAFGRGELAFRIVPPPEEELRSLAESFNAMGGELAVARGRLERWNDDLKAEVELRTRELREAQERLLQTQKLAAVGQLGAGVAHEINNPLAGILGNVQLLLVKRERAGGSESELATLRRMESSARRCRDITTTLLRFSQEAEGRMEVLQPNALLLGAVEASRGAFESAKVALKTHFDPGLPAMRGDSGQLSQVFLHLLSNARIATMEGGGSRVVVGSHVDGAELHLVVEDDGVGIAPEDRERIFEPFFTTKREWTSLGLGLAVAYRLVDEHQGRIVVESAPGEGTKVSVVLPIEA